MLSSLQTILSKPSYQNIAIFADEFGGEPILSQVLLPWTAQTLVTFPGPIRLIKPWRLEIDLLDYDYIPGSPYSVFNSRWQHLYTRYNDDPWLFKPKPPEKHAYFGYDVRDLAAAILSPTADVLYLSFPSLTGRRVILLWVCNIIPPHLKQDWINEIKRNYETMRYRNRADYINLRQHYSDLVVRVWRLVAPRRPKLSFDYVWNHPDRVLVAESFAESGFVELEKSGWYSFGQIIGNDSVVPVDVVNLSGSGSERFERVAPGLYYVSGANSATFTTNLSDLFSFDANINTVHTAIQLEADIDAQTP